MRFLFGAALIALSGCTAGAEGNPPPETGGMAPQTEAACLAAGGRWGPGGLFPDPLCFLPNPDAGKSCAKASDCVGTCLAESRTCAPVQPIFGCYAFLDEDGREVTICAD
ncbi:hypothetical protein [Maritimibacter sp. HL-12]|uniref:hypothetical protein n=1 Tax=Maritimibacter sp. HL-12 TaxID=1162418 RepID=UPI000A0F05DF|nr:hypothetical protein [Maritimibacter sp. HL-12]SMH33116.1 hypothetical protein SAMN05661107_0417 [Maritimibacter sp. HL-12]